MYARVAMYHGADAAGIDQMLAGTGEQIGAELESPPEGLEGVREVMLLVDRENGRGLGITLYETEEDLRRGDQELNQMSPSQAGGVRTAVEYYEVGLRRRAADATAD